MTWTNVAHETSNILGPASIPLLAGGDIWTTCGNVTVGSSNGVATICTTGGSLSQTAVTGDWGSQGSSQLQTDGTRVYAIYRDLFPRNWIVYWTISTLVATTTLGISYTSPSIVKLNNSNLIAIGEQSGTTTELWNVQIPAINYSANGSFSSGIAGYSVFDGTYIWLTGSNSTTLAKINASTLALVASYTLPQAAGQGFGQIGWDGQYLYIPGFATGVIVWDTVANSGVVESTSYQVLACFYSTNTSTLFISTEGASSTGSIYTMPLGGGSLTLSQTLNAAFLGGTGNALGFCDGPAGTDVWATVNDTVTSPLNLWFIKFTAGSGARIVMIL